MTEPTVGRIVIYRNRSGVDMPAIVTGLDAEGAPFLHCFPPPGAAAGGFSPEWGVEQADEHHVSQRWRWPERTT